VKLFYNLRLHVNPAFAWKYEKRGKKNEIRSKSRSYSDRASNPMFLLLYSVSGYGIVRWAEMANVSFSDVESSAYNSGFSHRAIN
jgi:hypothetical protein